MPQPQEPGAPLRDYLTKYASFSEEDFAQVFSRFEYRKVRKDEVLLAEGQICRHLYFLEQGLFRFYILKDGEEVTKYFTKAPYCFTSQQSFTARKPSAEFIQAIENSNVWQVSLEDAEALLELRSWSTFIRKLVQEVQMYTDNILLDVQTQTAEDRYIRMLSSDTDLVTRIPLKYLASYLGIAPQSLSRIRKRLSSGRS